MAEWGYNLVEGLERYKSDADLAIFLKVLKGEIPEDIVQEQNQMLEKLKAALQRADIAAEGKVTGKVARKEMFEVLVKMFPTKTKEDMHKLQSSVSKDQLGPVIAYPRLFEQTADLSQSNFVELLREQHLLETEEFMIEIEVIFAPK